MNGEYIRQKSVPELIELAKPFLMNFWQISNFEFLISKILKLEQPRLKKLSELPEKIDFFFKIPEYDVSLLRWKNMDDKEVKDSLELAKKLLQTITEENFTKENLEKIFLDKIGEGDKGKLLWPLRAALSGKKASPGPFEIMEVLGKNETLNRLEGVLTRISQAM